MRQPRVLRATWLSFVLPLLGLGAAGAACAQADRNSFSNPILPQGADPWVTAYKGVYYYTSTGGSRITLWRTNDITDLAHADQKVIWTPPPVGPNARSIWAPELHRLDSKWYIYYSATESGFGDDSHRAVFVLENSSENPLEGSWVDRGRLNTLLAGIDGTVFQHRGQLYFAYSPYVGAVSGIALAKLKNPWTVSGSEQIIAVPDKQWEQQGGRRIMEGPEFLPGPKGKVFMTYSAGACWSDNYSLGLLEADAKSDLLDPKSWKKHDQPVLSSANGVYATGHNGFFRSPDGREQWIVYHANADQGVGCRGRRAPHLGKVTWNASGLPVITPPGPPSELHRKPSGTRSR